MSMFFDGQMGKNIAAENCSCLYGTPIIDASGNCTCSDHPQEFIEPEQPQRMPPIRTFGNGNPRRVYMQNQYPTPTMPTPALSPTPMSVTTTAADDTILGLPKWVVYVSGAAAALYALSQMGDK